MKKAIPVLVALVLIAIIAGTMVAPQLINRITYSQEKADLNQYYHLSGGSEGAIVLNNKVVEEKAVVKDGTFYFDTDTVKKYFVASRIYINETENNLRYVLPNSLISCYEGQSVYSEGGQDNVCDYVIFYRDGETYYVAADFLRLVCAFDYSTYTNPNRIVISKDAESMPYATVKKDSNVRYQGGVKSDILTPVKKGDELQVLEELDTWDKVATADGYIGYIEKKVIDDPYEKAIQPVPSSVYGDAEYTGNTRDYSIKLGWHQIGGPGGNATLNDVLYDAKDHINVISPTWIHLAYDDGTIASYASADYVNKAHAMGLEVWVLVDDFTVKMNDYTVLSSTSQRESLIENIVEVVTSCGADGINIDFERVKEDAGPHFVQFLRELSLACKENNLVLSVDNYPPSGGAFWYDLAEQGVFCDYVIIMGYDEHWAGCETAGSVAGISYVENGIKDTLKKVPGEKLINGVPFYSRVWKTKGAEVTSDALGMDDLAKFIANNNVDMVWQEDLCQNYGSIQKGDTLYEVWNEDAASMQVRLEVMSTYNIAGVAAWKLGFESKGIWELIDTYY